MSQYFTIKPMRARAQKSQDRILRAAIAVIARKGYHRTRISDISDEAGVAYGLVYHYFGSKESILGTIIDSIEDRFRTRIEKIGMQKNVSINEKLGQISDYMFDTYLANPDMIHLLVREVVHSDQVSGIGQLVSARRILRQIDRIYNDAIECGELSADTDTELQAIAFFGSVQFVLTSLVHGFYGRKKSRSGNVRQIKRKMRNLLISNSLATGRNELTYQTSPS